MRGITDDILVFLLAGGQGQRLHPLTRDRAKPAVPFAANYRIIDFTLTNCIHSGLKRIYVFTQYRSLSLERHVKRGYSFLPRDLDEFIDSVPPQFRTASSWYTGTADAVYQNIYLLQTDRPKRTLILSGDHVYRYDYRDMLRRHLDAQAKMTIGVIEVPIAEASRMGVLEVDRDFRVVGFEEKPANPKPIPGREDVALASMGIYLFETDTLVRQVSLDAKTESSHDFGKDIVPRMVESGEAVYAFPFQDEATGEPGYWRDVGTIDAYFEAHRDVMGERPKFDLRDPDWSLFTWHPQLPATEIRAADGKEPVVLDSMMASGCEIAGGRVTNSVLGPGTRVGPGAVVEDTIVLGRVEIGAGATIRRAVVDLDNVIPAGKTINVDPDVDARDFIRSDGGIVVVAEKTTME